MSYENCHEANRLKTHLKIFFLRYRAFGARTSDEYQQMREMDQRKKLHEEAANQVHHTAISETVQDGR